MIDLFYKFWIVDYKIFLSILTYIMLIDLT